MYNHSVAKLSKLYLIVTGYIHSLGENIYKPNFIMRLILHVHLISNIRL